MAGRAGRRGIDTEGFIYACVDMEFNEYEDVENVVSGDIESIESQFNLSYSSILNLYHRHGENIYDVCKKSLSNYQNVSMSEQLDRSLERAREQREEELGKLVCIHGGDVKELWDYRRLEQELRLEEKALRFRERRPRQAHRQQQNVIRQNAKSVYDEITAELSRSKELMENYQRQQIEKRLVLLREMGYIDDKGLLPKGEVASQIYGYEVQITELLFDKHFHHLDPDQINVLIMAIVFESKRDCWYSEMEEGFINSIILGPSRRLEKIRNREEALEIDTPLKELDANLSAATYAWSTGCGFDELADYTDATPGDLVRYFRMVSDMLRQTRRATSDDDALLDKLNVCISKINRDVVDAERQLRAGQGSALTSS